MDASQYKDYILTLLFVKYVTDRANADPDTLIDVPPGGSFSDMVAARGKKDIGERLNTIIGVLAEASGLQKVIDLADFDDEEKLGKGQDMVDRLSALVGIFDTELDFSRSSAEGDDLLGDAYEYLMRHFATESGKSKGQFYTPAEVSRVIAKVIGIGPGTRQDETVYDPTCGSGSLLLKLAEEAPRGISIYGQENDVATWALAKMNMILHGSPEAVLAKGNTLSSPQFLEAHGTELRRFDFAVANPPFSHKTWTNGLTKDKEFGRFEYGRPPEKNGDYAFLLHVLTSLKSDGKAAIILPHGVLFRSGAEASIRRQLVDRGLIKGIIGLPANLFYGTGIPACILVLDKENAAARTSIFMIDASKGFIKDGSKNRLRSQDIHKIVDVFDKRLEIERYSRFVALSEIVGPANDYNLNLPRYVDSSDPEDIQDLHAHLHGGVPESDVDALGNYWEAFPQLRSILFTSDRVGYCQMALPTGEVRDAVLDSQEFRNFAVAISGMVQHWFLGHRAILQSLDARTVPQQLIGIISENLLDRFKATSLLDPYDVYEQLMSYWHGVMHDDVFMIMNDGWVEASKPRTPRVVGYDKNGKPQYENSDVQLGTGPNAARFVMDLIPPSLMVARYFPEEQRTLEGLKVLAAEAAQYLAEYLEEHAIEDGALWGAVDDKGKVTQKSTSAKLKEARSDGDEEGVAAAQEALRLLKADTDAKKILKDARTALDQATIAKYGELDEPAIKRLVLDDKWFTTINTRVGHAVIALTSALVDRVQELGARYADTLLDLETELALVESRVVNHMADMGVR